MINLGKIINNPTATKIGAIADLANYSMSAINAFMVKPEIPQFDEQGQISGFLFDVKGRDEVNLQAEITDHWTENNTAIQDHIAIKPITIRVNGFVGELRTNYDPKTLQNIAANYAGKSTALAYLAPEITTQAKAVFNQMERLYGLYEKANSVEKNLYAVFENTASAQTETKQQKAFQFFKNAWQARQAFQVQSPWQTFDNMYIQTLRATQDDETKYITEFEITFKQLRFANTLTRGLTDEEKEQIKAEKLTQQAAEQKDKGTQNGTKKSGVSFFKQFTKSAKENISGAWAEIKETNFVKGIYNAITK